MPRVYILSELSFADALKRLIVDCRAARSRLSSPFDQVVYTTWNERLVRVDFQNNLVLTILGDDWHLDLRYSSSSYDQTINTIMLTGDIIAFEKWELLLKLGDKAKSDTEPDP